MQEPTHILTGAILQKVLEGKPRAVTVPVIAVTAFLSHGFLDKLAQITYHPAQPDFHSPFWVTYHLTLLAVTIGFLRLWWRRYKWGVTFAMLPDFDWIMVHGQEIFHIQIPFYREPLMHHLLGYIWEKIPPFSFVTPWLGRLPNYRHQPWACLNEVLIVGGLLVVFWLLTLGKSYQPRMDGKGENGQGGAARK